MSTKVRTLDFITPVAISDTVTSNRKKYRDLSIAVDLMKKYNVVVNKEMTAELERKDNENNPLWD